MLEQIYDYKYIVLIGIILVLIIITVLVLSRKKVKPINMDEVLDKKEEKSKIEEVLEAMESSTSNRPMTTFEQEQEANAIISYQELVKAVEAKKANSEFKTEPEVKDTTISQLKTTIVEPEVKAQPILEADAPATTEIESIMEEAIDDIEVPEEKPKFKNSEFISPVFGKDQTKGDDFLKELKDLRKNL